jgi:hypothetical protein
VNEAPGTTTMNTLQLPPTDASDDIFSYFDTKPFVNFCIQVRKHIGKKPVNTATIKRKVGNDRWLQDALDTLIGAGEVERVQMGAMSGYLLRDEVKQVSEPNWNGRKATKKNDD